MNYIKQLNAFNDLFGGQLSPTSRALYYALLDINNALRWTREFTVSNSSLRDKLQIKSNQSFINARNELIQKGLIIYKRSKKTSVSVYSIVELYQKDDSENSSTYGQVLDEFWTSSGQVLDKFWTSFGQADPDKPAPTLASQTPLNINIKHKTINNKLIQKESVKEKADCSSPKTKTVRHQYGEYKNVLLSDNEIEKLKAEFPDDWQQRIEKVSAYCEAHGKSYKNYLATIRNWARMDKERKENNAVNKQIAGDTKRKELDGRPTGKYAFLCANPDGAAGEYDDS